MNNTQKNIVRNEYYVYGLVNPIDNTIFYIGKGLGKRAYDHLKPSGWGKNQHKLYKIKKIRESGKEPIVVFLHEYLNEKTAFEMEIIEIKRLRKNGVNLTNMTDGGDSGPIRFGKRTELEKQVVSEKTKEAMWKPEIRERHLKSIRSESNKKRLSENQIFKLKNNKDWYEKFTKSNYNEKYRTVKIIRDDGIVFNSAEDVANFYETRLNVITRHLAGKRKTYKAHKFRYLDI
jgi:hypothetical protein